MAATATNIDEIKKFQCPSDKELPGDYFGQGSSFPAWVRDNQSIYARFADVACMYKFIYFQADGNWGDWKEWTKCSKTCGSGKRSRTRDCNNPAPALGGKACPGSSMESGVCKTNSCPGAF